MFFHALFFSTRSIQIIDDNGDFGIYMTKDGKQQQQQTNKTLKMSHTKLDISLLKS